MSLGYDVNNIDAVVTLTIEDGIDNNLWCIMKRVNMYSIADTINSYTISVYIRKN